MPILRFHPFPAPARGQGPLLAVHSPVWLALGGGVVGFRLRPAPLSTPPPRNRRGLLVVAEDKEHPPQVIISLPLSHLLRVPRSVVLSSASRTRLTSFHTALAHCHMMTRDTFSPWRAAAL